MNCIIRKVRGQQIVEHDGVAFLPNASLSAQEGATHERQSYLLRAQFLLSRAQHSPTARAAILAVLSMQALAACALGSVVAQALGADMDVTSTDAWVASIAGLLF